MAICDSCKGNSILPEHYGALTLCKKCFMKILAPTWKNKIYSTNEEVHEQREKTLARAVSAGFPSDAITKLGSYFDGLIIPGLFKIFDGGNDQGLVVKDESVIIVTEDDFDPSDARKQLGLIASGRRGLSIDEDDNVDAFDAANLAKIALGAFSSGGSLGKIAMRAGAEIAGEVISKSNRPTIDDLPVLPQFDVPFGEQTVRYKDVDDFEFYIPEGEENLGFLLFTTAVSRKQKKIVFSFDPGENRKQAAIEIARFIESKLDDKVAEAEEQEESMRTANSPSRQADALSAPDELLKWKQLLDAGAITNEDYAAKKKQLLGL